jgi:hypothetical protein
VAGHGTAAAFAAEGLSKVASGCSSLRDAIGAGWRYPSLAARDRILENLRTNYEFQSLAAT